MSALDTDFAGIPCDEEGPPLREPWEAQSFAMALALHRAGMFQWREWAAMLAEEIERAQAAGDPDTGETYYRHWQAMLERMIVERGLSDTQAIDRHSSAWAHAARPTARRSSSRSRIFTARRKTTAAAADTSTIQSRRDISVPAGTDPAWRHLHARERSPAR